MELQNLYNELKNKHSKLDWINLIDKINKELRNMDKLSGLCEQNIITGACHCCEFPEDLDTFIGLLPYEYDYLVGKDETPIENKFDIKHKDFGVVCKNIEWDCKRKPLDCLIYPFALANYTGDTVDILIGTEVKCPLYFYKETLSEEFLHPIKKFIKLIRDFDEELIRYVAKLGEEYNGYELFITINMEEIK